MSKRGIFHFHNHITLAVSWQETKLFSGRPYLFEVSRSILLMVNQSTEGPLTL